MPAKKKLMTLKQQLRNVLIVTTLQKEENYGTGAEVVEFGCRRSVAGGTVLDGYLCDICL